jgi:predicted component of type VI protein secretion system
MDISHREAEDFSGGEGLDHELQDGDRLRVGNTVLRMEIVPSEAADSHWATPGLPRRLESGLCC